ncbi:hypothetical protein DRN86_02670 [Candidatus Geothermarchaeota archaeon]|nr:MAG: hypothetical protein DRN86_02670 [Candidatus Geothermarchaeota archaeon]
MRPLNVKREMLNVKGLKNRLVTGPFPQGIPPQAESQRDVAGLTTQTCMAKEGLQVQEER